MGKKSRTKLAKRMQAEREALARERKEKSPWDEWVEDLTQMVGNRFAENVAFRNEMITRATKIVQNSLHVRLHGWVRIGSVEDSLLAETIAEDLLATLFSFNPIRKSSSLNLGIAVSTYRPDLFVTNDDESVLIFPKKNRTPLDPKGDDSFIGPDGA